MHCFSLHHSFPALGLSAVRKMFPYYPGSTSKVGRPAAPVGKRTPRFQKAPVTGRNQVDGQGQRGGERDWSQSAWAEKLPLGEGGGRTKWVGEPWKVGFAEQNNREYDEKLKDWCTLREEKWDCINNTQRKCVFPYWLYFFMLILLRLVLHYFHGLPTVMFSVICVRSLYSEA